MKNPINISEYINKIDTIIIGQHNTPNAISGKAYILGENEYILFNRDNIPMIVNNNPILYVNQFFQQMDDAILSEKTVFQSYSEYKNEMLNYPKDRRFGDIDWMYGYKDFYGSLKASQNSMRAIKMREFDAMLNTIVRHSNKVKENKYVEYDISELDMKMLRTAFDMQAYGYILYKIFESIHKNRKISEDEKFEVVLLDMIKEFSLFLHNDKNPYLMVGKR